MKNFLIIKLSSLGDIIHTLPSFAALKKKLPEAKITWLVEDNGKEILDLVPGLDEVIVIQTRNLRGGIKKSLIEIRRLKKALKNKNQIALDFQGLIKSGFFAYLSRAKVRIGFHKKNLREPLASLFYTDRLHEISEEKHVISKNLGLLIRVGVKNGKYDFPLSIPDELSESVNNKLKTTGYKTDSKMIVYNVGAAWETKRWDFDSWVDYIERMKRKKIDYFSLLLWGNESERTLAEKIHKTTHVPLAPALSIKEVIALLQKASLLVSGDTFALQAACALSVPVVGLFGPTNPKRNGPFNPHDKVIFHELQCSYCYKRKCSSLECLKKITPEKVENLSLQIIEENV